MWWWDEPVSRRAAAWAWVGGGFGENIVITPGRGLGIPGERGAGGFGRKGGGGGPRGPIPHPKRGPGWWAATPPGPPKKKKGEKKTAGKTSCPLKREPPIR